MPGLCVEREYEEQMLLKRLKLRQKNDARNMLSSTYPTDLSGDEIRRSLHRAKT